MTNEKLNAKTIRAAKTAVAAAVKPTYFETLSPALFAIGEALTALGLSVEGLEGIYCGHDGRTSTQLAGNLWLTITWHRMESGRFEVVAYAS